MFALLMGLKTISPDGLRRLLDGPEPVSVIDVNTPQSWMNARVPGAKHLAHDTFGETDLPPAKDDALVFYCSNPMCRKAPNAARHARELGYRNVRVMAAGINGWLAAKLPTESGT